MADKISHTVFLSLGSNLGDRIGAIGRAYEEIEKRIGKIISRSAFYLSEPEGFESENSFVNSVCKVVTDLLPYKLLEETRQIEKELGRCGKSIDGRYADRIIDIDMLMYDSRIIEDQLLTVPHPRFHLRGFVLVPFAEISPDTVHPVQGKTILVLRNELGEPTGVHPIR